MLTVRSYIFLTLRSLFILFLLAGCAAESKGPVATIYHNVTARYNAYFLAKEKMTEVENALEQAQERNFNKLLHIFPEVDTNVVNSLQPQLEDVLKKASIAIDRHKHSKWVDDSYILVGKTRFYNQEFEHAVETFKYVNIKSEDDDARHLALVNLLRTFVDHQELNNAKAVADYLRKEKLNKENSRKYAQTLAYFYQHRQDWEQMAAALEIAAPLTPKKEGRARLFFLLGQLYQQLGYNKKAYESFRQTLKSNPDYELSFYARLNMAQVFDLSEEQDEKKIRRYFSKLLKDKKNREYRDKIYYELGRFEERQGNLEEAISNYQKAVRASIDNTRQKSYAYLALAELYYDTFSDYPMAKVYYDSTMMQLPADELNYADVEQRQQVLGELVTQLTTIYEKDSLLRLVQLDSLSLHTYLQEVAREEMAEQQRQARLVENAQINQVNVRPGFNTIRDNFGMMGGDQAGSSGWYFYNTNLVGIGRAEFIKKWGERPLQDNWRHLSQDQRENTNVVTQQQEIENFTEDQASANLSPEEIIANRSLELRNTLPLSEEQQVETLAQVETAYYKLGKIYTYELEEPKKAVLSFDTLLQRFPSTEYEPEVLYQLYLLHKNSNPTLAEQYKEELIRRFPNTSFARVAENPNYQEERDQASAYLKEVYAQAYKLYQRAAYKSADSLLQVNLRQYPENPFSEQLSLLQILVTGKTDGTARYQYELNQFIEKAQNETLKAYANELLQASYNFGENNAKRQGTRFIEDFDQPHYFILVYENKENLADTLIKVIDSFILDYKKQAGLKATNLKLSNSQFMVYVSQFPDRGSSMQYFRELERSKLIPEVAKNAKPKLFVISRDNFQILYDTKDIDSYLKFFTKFYN